MNWLKSLYYRRQRRIDLEILWPACLDLSHSVEHARAAFAQHAYHDPAWLWLGKDAIWEVVSKLDWQRK